MRRTLIAEESVREQIGESFACPNRKLSHPKLVQLYGVCSQQKPIYIVTEFMEHGSLLHFLQRGRGGFSLGSLLSISLDVCEGMEYLEAHGFIHRDLVSSSAQNARRPLRDA